MQFYAVFPILVLLSRKAGWLLTAILVAAAGVVVVWVIERLGIGFPMPAFLPLKMHLFLCGMLIAADHRNSAGRLGAQIGLALILAAIPVGGRQGVASMIVRELLVLVFFFLVHWRTVGVINFVSGLLGRKLFHWLGELSFGVYLVHLLIMQPVSGWAIRQFGASIGDFARFCVVLGIVVPTAYLIAFVTYRAIEVPGQKLGKRHSKTFDPKSKQVEAGTCRGDRCALSSLSNS